MPAASRPASTRSTPGWRGTTARPSATATTSCSSRAERTRSRRDHGPAVARPAHQVEQHLAPAIRGAPGAVAVVQEPPVATRRLKHGPVARALPVPVGLQDRVLLRASPWAVDAVRARHAEGVFAGTRGATVAARVEEVEPAVTADDPRPLDQAALPAVAVPDHDPVRRPRQLQAVAGKWLHPDRARHAAAVLLPDEEGAAVDVVHHARVDRG